VLTFDVVGTCIDFKTGMRGAGAAVSNLGESTAADWRPARSPRRSKSKPRSHGRRMLRLMGGVGGVVSGNRQSIPTHTHSLNYAILLPSLKSRSEPSNHLTQAATQYICSIRLQDLCARSCDGQGRSLCDACTGIVTGRVLRAQVWAHCLRPQRSW